MAGPVGRGLRGCAVLASLAIGCAPSQSPATPGRASDLVKVARAPVDSGSGSIQVTVRWPARTALAIPDRTERIAVDAFSGASTPASSVLMRPPFEGYTTATLGGIPAGQVRIAAVARDVSGAVLATGALILTLRTNELAQAAIKLSAPVVEPSIDRVQPLNSFPTRWVTLVGQGFGFSTGASFSVQLGGVTIAGAKLSRPSDQMVSFEVPLEATNSKPVLRVGDLTVVSPTEFVTIASVSLETSHLEIEKGMRRPMGYTVLDALGNPVLNPLLVWSIPYAACTGCMDGTAIWVEPDGTILPEEDLYSGEAIMMLGIPPVAATASVKVLPARSG